METAQPLAEALEHRQGARQRVLAQVLVLVQAGGQAHGLLEAVDLVDLGGAILLDDAADRKSKAVGAEVDGGQKMVHAAVVLGSQFAGL
ncbi:hypothetical protein BPJ_32990 [Bordetella pertussis]|nr:hypothetical protein BPJ_32990 [Bordetella pertussis]BDT09300.1 hypothetical protein BP3J_30040 [Bordetella pertussis]